MIRDWDSDFGGIGPGIGVVLELGWNCLGIGIDWGLRRLKRRVSSSQVMVILTPIMLCHDDYNHFCRYINDRNIIMNMMILTIFCRCVLVPAWTRRGRWFVLLSSGSGTRSKAHTDYNDDC